MNEVLNINNVRGYLDKETGTARKWALGRCEHDKQGKKALRRQD